MHSGRTHMEGLQMTRLAFILSVGVYYSLALSEVGDIDLGCPIGSFKFGSICYSLKTLRMEYDHAELMCNEQNGTLAPIKDKEAYLSIQKLRIRQYLSNYWINLNDKQLEGTWVHGDKTPVKKFQKWASGEPNNFRKNQHCAHMWRERFYDWDDSDCSDKFQYICQYSGSNCNVNSFPFGQYCYELSTDRKNFDDAQRKCQEKGGTLANDKTEDIHQFLKKLIYADRRWKELSEVDVQKFLEENNEEWMMPGNWFGLRGVDGDWRFSDGVLLKETSFSKWTHPPQQKNTCAYMKINWIEESCSVKKSLLCRYTVMTKVGTPETQVALQQTQEEYTGVRITSSMLAFVSIACIVFGALLLALPLVIGKLTNRLHISIGRTSNLVGYYSTSPMLLTEEDPACNSDDRNE